MINYGIMFIVSSINIYTKFKKSYLKDTNINILQCVKKVEALHNSISYLVFIVEPTSTSRLELILNRKLSVSTRAKSPRQAIQYNQSVNKQKVAVINPSFA